MIALSSFFFLKLPVGLGLDSHRRGVVLASGAASNSIFLLLFFIKKEDRGSGTVVPESVNSNIKKKEVA